MTRGQRRRTWGAGALALLAATISVSASPANAEALGGPIHLPPAARRLDNTLPAGPILLDGLELHYVQFTVDASAEPGTVELGPCGEPADTILHFDEATVQSSLQFVDIGSCASLSTPARLIIDDFGYDGDFDGTGYTYVPLDAPAEVLGVADTIGPGDVTLPLDDLLLPGAGGAAIELIGYAVEGAGYAALHECGTPVPPFSNLPLNASTLNGNIAYATFTPGAQLCLYVNASAGANIGATVYGSFTVEDVEESYVPPSLIFVSEPPPGLAPRPPLRVLDTRNGIGAPVGIVPAGHVVELDLSDEITPDTSAVVMNVTATDTTAWGYVTVYACGDGMPDTSNVNFDSAGDNVPNQVTVDVSSDGTVCLFASAATHLLADLAGTYEYGGGKRFTAVDPIRILDTRTGTGAPASPLGAGQTLSLQVAGQHGVPADASAITMNLTAADAHGWGYVTAYPCDAPLPEASNLNYLAGQTVPNLVTVQLSATGTVCLFSYTATDLLADVAGYYNDDPAGAGLETYTPTRLWDTRDDGEPLDYEFLYPLSITGDETAAEAGITAVITNLTVNDPIGPGYLTAYPCTDELPDASNVNYDTGETVANQAVVKLSEAGEICLVTYDDTHAIVDLFGAFTTGAIWYQFLR